MLDYLASLSHGSSWVGAGLGVLSVGTASWLLGTPPSAGTLMLLGLSWMAWGLTVMALVPRLRRSSLPRPTSP